MNKIKMRNKERVRPKRLTNLHVRIMGLKAIMGMKGHRSWTTHYRELTRQVKHYIIGKDSQKKSSFSKQGLVNYCRLREGKRGKFSSFPC